MYGLILYTTPEDASIAVNPDAGGVYTGEPYVDPNGRMGQIVHLPSNLPNGHGGYVDIQAIGYIPMKLRGIIWLNPDSQQASLQVDDFMLEMGIKEEPEPEPIPPNMTPVEIINHVYQQTQADLSTHEGCGKFTEDCCKALHEAHNKMWGHIDKEPGQNQYNGHAVDAVQLLGSTDDCAAGIYDIIMDSVSSNAKPAFNWKSEPDFDLWVYPPESFRIGLGKIVSPARKG